MWTFSQSTGQLHDSTGELFATGFAGREGGYCNPDAQALHDIGPLPRGLYHMTRWFDRHATVGLCAIELTPDKSVDMLGRFGFLIHGASATHPAESSHGCPVIGNCETRHRIWASLDHDFMVVA